MNSTLTFQMMSGIQSVKETGSDLYFVIFKLLLLKICLITYSKI